MVAIDMWPASEETDIMESCVNIPRASYSTG